MLSGMGLFSFFKSNTPAPDARPTAKVIRGPWRVLRKRAFKAAWQDRTTADWLMGGRDINEELRAQLETIRNRARELEQNGDHARRFLSQVQIHVVGSAGFNLQVKGTLRNGKLDKRNNKIIEKAFWKWARRRCCDVTGHYALADIERLAVRTLARDGEHLIRLHDIKPTARNPFGFALEILDPARLDVNLNDDPRDGNGNRIRMGIEYDRAGSPVAYYLSRRTDGAFSRNTYDRVPAENIIHDFIAERPEQLRGIPWMVSAMVRMHQVGEYEDSALVAAREGANKMGFFTTPGGSLAALQDGTGADGELISESSAGHFGHLPAGYGFTPYNPEYPHANFEGFMRGHLRSIAMGLGVSYHGLTGDLSQVNFSSSRTGTLEERESWMVIQDFFSSGTLERIYARWLSAALMNDQIKINVNIDEALDRYAEHLWQGRRWPWIDPQKDIDAAIAAIGAGLKSPQMVAAEMGVDIEDVLDAIADFQTMAREKGVTLSAYKTSTGTQSNDNSANQDNTNAAS